MADKRKKSGSSLKGYRKAKVFGRVVLVKIRKSKKSK